MEPVTHILTGACLARTGLNRRAAYTTLAMAVAAELPDIDTVWSLRGPISSFQHHRGITHTFVAIPVEAAVVVLACYGIHRVRMARARKNIAAESGSASTGTAAPVRWGWLYCFVLLALLSHLFLDFTNNYGLRPFFPFNPRWYAASITFIFDPLMFVLLLGALVLPSLFRLVSSEVGARRQTFAARGWAICALLGIVALWTFRETQHNRAVSLAMAQSIAAPGSSSSPDVSPPYLQPQRVLASPDPFSPFRWWTVTDFGPAYQLGRVDTRNNTMEPAQQTQPKLAVTPALQAAEGSKLGRAYLDWSPMPFLTVQRGSLNDVSDDAIAPGHTLVLFRDPRFMGDVPGMRGRTPLQGSVELDANNRVVRQAIDDRPEPRE